MSFSTNTTSSAAAAPGGATANAASSSSNRKDMRRIDLGMYIYITPRYVSLYLSLFELPFFTSVVFSFLFIVMRGKGELWSCGVAGGEGSAGRVDRRRKMETKKRKKKKKRRRSGRVRKKERETNSLTDGEGRGGNSDSISSAVSLVGR